MFRFHLIILLLLGLFTLVACAQNNNLENGLENGAEPGPGTVEAGDVPVEMPPEVEAAARTALSNRLEIPAEELEIISNRYVEWPTSCLGLPEDPSLACVQVETPGWAIMFDVGGWPVEVHSDSTAENIRIDEETLLPVATIVPP